MSVPSSVTKVKKGGIEFTSNVDRVKYTMKELSRAALRDVGKFVSKETRKNIDNAGIKKRTGRMKRNVQYWVRKQDVDLQVGIKPQGFYGGFQETGTFKQPKIGALSAAVYDNIDTIRDIEGKYLSHIEDEQRAMAAIDENDYEGSEND